MIEYQDVTESMRYSRWYDGESGSIRGVGGIKGGGGGMGGGTRGRRVQEQEGRGWDGVEKGSG